MSKSKDFSGTSVSRYSLALFELAEESNSTKEIEDQSFALINMISKNKEFNYFIKNPTNSKEDQQKTIIKISEQFKLNELLTKFLCFLISKRRFFYIEKILKDFTETCSKKKR